MRFFSRRTPLFALLFLLAFGFSARAQNPQNGPITLDVASPLALTQKPLALQVRKGRWFPVAVTLTNSGEPVQGRLTLKTTTATQRDQSITTYFTDVDLPTTARKRIWLYGRVESEDVNAFVVTFQGRGFKGMKAEGLLQIASLQTRLVLTISDSDEKLSYLAGLKGVGLGLPDDVGSTPSLNMPPGAGNPNLNLNAAPVRPLETAHDLIPSRWIGFDAVDLVVLQDFPHTALTPNQIATLRGYAAGGGALLALGGANWQRLSTSPLADLWPVVPQSSGTASAADMSLLINRFARFPVMTGADRLGGAPVVVTRGTLKKGNRVLLGSKDAPLLAANDFGAGEVLFLSVDLTQPPFLGWRGLERMWPDIFRPTSRPAQIASVGEAQFDEDNYRNGNPYAYQNGQPQTDATADLLEALKTSKQLKTPPVSSIAWFLALYVFFLVPVNYIVLRFFDRRELAWITIPVIVVAFSVMSYAAALKIKGTAILTRQVNIIQTSDRSNLARADAMLWLFSPRKTTYDISSRDPQMVVGDYLSDKNVSVEIREPEENQAFALDDTPINMWDWRTFVGHSAVDMKGGVSVAIQNAQSGKAQVGIANNSPFDLKGAVLVSGGSVLGYGTVRAGSTSFSGKSDGVSLANAQVLPSIRSASRLESELPGNQVGGFQTIPDKLLQAALARDRNFSDGSTSGTLIVAWSDKPFAGLTIGRGDGVAQNLTLLVVRVEDDAAIRPALLKMHVPSITQGDAPTARVRRLDYAIQPYQKNRQAGTVSTYEAVLKNAKAQRVSLALKIALENQYGYPQAASVGSVKTPTVEFFDFSTGAWRVVSVRDLDAEKYEAEKAKNPKSAQDGKPLTWDLRVLLSTNQTRAFMQEPDGRLQFRVRTFHDDAQIKEVTVQAK